MAFLDFLLRALLLTGFALLVPGAQAHCGVDCLPELNSPFHLTTLGDLGRRVCADVYDGYHETEPYVQNGEAILYVERDSTEHGEYGYGYCGGQ